MILFFIWVVIGQSWNVLAGYTGRVSFGHAAFFGVAAYTSTLLFAKFGLSPWIGMPIAGIAAIILAIPIGIICLPLRGPYFALAMLALAEVLKFIALNWRSLTNGAVGLLITPPLFISKIPYYYISLILAILTVISMLILLSSKLGYYFLAIREDEDAAEALGINTTKYKLISLMISALFMGLAGSFYANYMLYIDPHIVFSVVDISIAAILVAIFGGVGTIAGPVIGALGIVMLSEASRTAFQHAHLLVYGTLIIMIVIFLPEGIVGGIRRYIFPAFEKKEQSLA